MTLVHGRSDMDSILDSMKKMLGISREDTSFDTDIIFHINSALAAVSQITGDVAEGVMIESDSESWDEVLGDRNDLEFVKELVFIKVKMMFDPPSSSYAMTAMKDREEKLEWYIHAKGIKE